eukprot:RCo008918
MTHLSYSYSAEQPQKAAEGEAQSDGSDSGDTNVPDAPETQEKAEPVLKFRNREAPAKGPEPYEPEPYDPEPYEPEPISAYRPSAAAAPEGEAEDQDEDAEEEVEELGASSSAVVGSGKAVAVTAQEEDDDDEEEDQSSLEESSEEGMEDSDGVIHPAKPRAEVAIRFRNYQPRDPALKEKRVKRKRDEEDAALHPAEPSAEEEAGGGAGGGKPKSAEDAVLSLLPKKLNHDLKKAVEPKLELLRRRTQKVILQLIQEKVAEQEEEED